MAKSLKDYKKNKYRFTQGEVFLREPNRIEKQELCEIISNNQQLQIQGELVEEEVGMNVIRYILKEFTNFSEEIDSLSDEEIDEVLNDGIREIELLVYEIEKLINECVEDIGRNIERQYKMINDMLNVFDANGNYEKMKTKWNKLNKKYKLNLDFDEIINNQEKQDKLIKAIQEQK